MARASGVKRSEIWKGEDNIRKKSFEILSNAKVTSDICHDHRSPAILATFAPYKVMLSQLREKGVRQRYLTEITPDNLPFCKYLGGIVELRHLQGVKGNFAIVDGKEYGAIADLGEDRLPTEFIHSNIDMFVEQQQYFFEMLWNKAIPGEQRVREIEHGIVIENTEVIEGTENVIRQALEGLSLTRKSFDNCIDHTCPNSYVSAKIIWDKVIDMRRRGVRLRFITEITPENIEHCKKMAKEVELRHLESITGNFGISDRLDYRGTPTIEQGQPPTQAIRSTVRAFVDQQQYFFETLWNKAIPAEDRFLEIEEGIAPETIDTFSDSGKAQQFALSLVKSAEKELLVMLASHNEFKRQFDNENGFLRALSNASRKKQRLDIRITLPIETEEAMRLAEKYSTTKMDMGNRHQKQEKTSQISRAHSSVNRSLRLEPRMDLRYFDSALRTNVTILIVDRKYALVIESKDSDSEKQRSNRDSAGLAIYTNSKAIVFSYVSIFELMWTHFELYEEIKARELAEKEFLDIAVHELRTPIQPILGLAAEIRDRQKENSEGRLLSVILRSASNLQRLADNLLDVARIQNNSLRLSRDHFDLNDLISSILAEYLIEASRSKNISIQFKRSGPGKGKSGSVLHVHADRTRIYQVITNLVQNALKFTQSGGSIVISTKKVGNQARVTVSDNGPGISIELLPKLFTKFATGSRSNGTGLGLFISNMIVEAHGGKLKGQNNGPGKPGASFSFNIPAELSPLLPKAVR